MSRTSQTFTVRWGKLSLALVGLLAVVAVPVTLVLALTVGMSWFAPLVCLGLVALSLAGLRASAVQDRRKKAWKQAAAAVPAALIDSALKDAADRAASVEAEQAESAPAQQHSAEDAVAAADVQETKQKAEDLPFDVLADQETPEVVEAAPEEAVAETAPAAQESSSDETWEPREIPAPSYVGAKPVQRSAPAPLPQAESKRAEVVTSIRKAEAARQEEEEAQRAQRLNLDAVLQRRRA